ncbi:hypothetical protein TWF694_010521 [Orbilia ellipsospora]|uniref:Uncharacterized protein n=1 Tax=Orbilia ellipsospora TaxID=2528407 RepID=A0AAV9XD77_9PEZI
MDSALWRGEAANVSRHRLPFSGHEEEEKTEGGGLRESSLILIGGGSRSDWQIGHMFCHVEHVVLERWCAAVFTGVLFTAQRSNI